MSSGARSLFVAGDWGTSTFRLFLCQIYSNGSAAIVAEASGSGVRDVSDFEAEFLRVLSKLPADAFSTATYIAGMAGSTLGWKETAYAQCQVAWRDLAKRMVPVVAGAKENIWLVPGISCVNRFGAPEFMRGEETQLLGWWSSQEELTSMNSLVCLPGTHTKWTICTREAITRFETSIQGEMFDVLNNHSILTRGAKGAEHRDDAFRRGVAFMRDHKSLALSAALFSVRSLQLANELIVDDAPSYLSGLLIGAEVRDIAVNLVSEEDVSGAISLVGEPRLCRLYSLALSEYGIRATESDGRLAVIRGLESVHRERVQAL